MFERMSLILGFVARHPGFRAGLDMSDPTLLWIVDPEGEGEVIPATLGAVRAWLGY